MSWLRVSVVFVVCKSLLAKRLVVVVHKKFDNLPAQVVKLNVADSFGLAQEPPSGSRVYLSNPNPADRLNSQPRTSNSKGQFYPPPYWSRSNTSGARSIGESCEGPPKRRGNCAQTTEGIEKQNLTLSLQRK